MRFSREDLGVALVFSIPVAFHLSILSAFSAFAWSIERDFTVDFQAALRALPWAALGYLIAMPLQRRLTDKMRVEAATALSVAAGCAAVSLTLYGWKLLFTGVGLTLGDIGVIFFIGGFFGLAVLVIGSAVT